MIESLGTERQWRKHWADTTYADDCTEEKKGKTRADIVHELLDCVKVSGVVEAEESVVFKDSKTKEIVFIFIRDFEGDEELLRRWTQKPKM